MQQVTIIRSWKSAVVRSTVHELSNGMHIDEARGFTMIILLEGGLMRPNVIGCFKTMEAALEAASSHTNQTLEV